MNHSLFMLGTAVSILALAIIASVSFNAWQRIAPDALVPVNFKRDGEPGIRMKKHFALLLMPAVATVLLMMLSAQPRGMTGNGSGMLLTLQVLVAVGFVAAHIVHVKNALEVLEREGKLRS